MCQLIPVEKQQKNKHLLKKNENSLTKKNAHTECSLFQQINCVSM